MKVAGPFNSEAAAVRMNSGGLITWGGSLFFESLRFGNVGRVVTVTVCDIYLRWWQFNAELLIIYLD